MKIITRDEEKNKDKRHTNKPYTKMMWEKYEKEWSIFTTEELMRRYGVSRRTIYRWNSEMKARWKMNNQKWLEPTKIKISFLKDIPN